MAWIQIGFIAYVFLFVIFFAWKSIIGYAIVALVAAWLLVFLSAMEKFKLTHYPFVTFVFASSWFL